MGVEEFKFNGKLFALILRKDTHVENTKFFSPEDSSLQLGIIKHKKGYVEKPHIHKHFPKTISDTQETLYVEHGEVEINFYNDKGEKLGSSLLKAGDTVLLIYGGHAIRVLEDFKGVKVKQGPYHGIEEDKEFLDAKNDTSM